LASFNKGLQHSKIYAKIVVIPKNNSY
jgi:hypothetical protein